MSDMFVRCVVVLGVGLVSNALGFLQPDVEGAAAGTANKVSSGTTGAASQVAGTLPRVPEAPLPGVAGPKVPGVGSTAPHTADPVVCGLLGGIIVANWILACCCAGFGAAGAGAAAVEEEKGDTKDAEAAGAAGGVCGALFACVECLASICSIIALIYAAFTGLFRAWLGGQAVSGWCLAMAIISTLQLVACVCICCCATCCSAVLGAEVYDKYVNQHSKHVFGSHMHELVHKHKPDGTHPITEGHIPMHEHIHKHLPIARAAGPPKAGKTKNADKPATETTPLKETTESTPDS